MKQLLSAIKGALENYETPDSPEGLAAAMRTLRMEFEFAEVRAMRARRARCPMAVGEAVLLDKREAKASGEYRAEDYDE